MTDEIRLASCPSCGANLSVDRNAALPRRCPSCGVPIDGTTPKPEKVETSNDSSDEIAYSEGLSGIFLRTARELGFLTEKQWSAAGAAFAAEKRRGARTRLIDVLIANEFMTREQCVAVRDHLRKSGVRVRIGPYRILKKLGHGGMGGVYMAESSVHGVVALKILPRELASNDEFLRRFHRESALVRELNHPNAVRFFDAGQDAGNYYIAMEYVEGESVAERMARRGRISEMHALRIVRDIANALTAADALGIVHRDIKPANILLPRNGAAKLADLGLSKRPGEDLEKSLTRFGIRVGTPAYMSPEQCMGEKDLDARSDIYSLGATLYRMVTGSPPFVAERQVQVLHRHLHTPVRPPIELNAKITRRLNRLICKMLEKAPDDRFPTPLHLYRYLDNLIKRREEHLEELRSVREMAAAARRQIEAIVEASDSPASPPKRRSGVEAIVGSSSLAEEDETSDEIVAIADEETDTGEFAALADDEVISADTLRVAIRTTQIGEPSVAAEAELSARFGFWARHKTFLILLLLTAAVLIIWLIVYIFSI